MRKSSVDRVQSSVTAGNWVILVLALHCQLSAAAPCFAGDGTTAGAAAGLGVDARALAMGEAQTAAAEGASGLYWNPASLTGLKGYSVTFMRAAYPASVTYNYGALATRLGRRSAWGVGLQSLSWGEIPWTDSFGFKQGSVSPSESVVSVGFAHRFPIFSLGLTAKSVNASLESTDDAFAWDAGLLSPAFWGQRLTVGAAALNQGGRLGFKGESAEISSVYKAGVAFKAGPGWTADLDVVSPKAEDGYLALGAEYERPVGGNMAMALRGGYNTRSTDGLGGSAGMTAGAGLTFGGMALDYAFLPMGDLGATHRMSLSYDNRFTAESAAVFFSNMTALGGSFMAGSAKLAGDAEKYGVGSSGSYWGVGMDSLWLERVPVNLGMVFYNLKDEKSFQQTVVGTGNTNQGQVSTESSDVESMGFFLESGFRFKAEKPLAAGVNAGYLYSDDPERGISNCTDCASQEIPLGGGQLYVAPVLGLSFTSVELLISHRQFLTSGLLKSQFNVHLAWVRRFSR